MKTDKIALVVLGLVALGMIAPVAVMANDSVDESEMPSMVLTIVCPIYSDHLEGAVSGIDLIMGINLGEYMSDCKLTLESIETTAEPSAITLEASIPDGALYPTCAETNDCFTPYNLTVNPGTTVIWTNDDIVVHTVTASEPHPDGDFNGWVLPGEEYAFTFNTPGTYTYGCIVHPWAQGVMVVSDDTEPDVAETELAQDLVEELIALYMENGEVAFETINGMKSIPDQPVVGFVVNSNDYILVAHSQLPDLYVGLNVKPVLDNAFIPIDDLLAFLEEEKSGAWLTYPVPNLLTGQITGYERGWMKMYDGYVFVGRYAVDAEANVIGVVSDAIDLYDRVPNQAFNIISARMSIADSYVFVVDPNTTTVVAHGSNPDRVGGVSTLLTNSTVPLEEFRGLAEGEGIWSDYTFLRPATGTEELKRSWVVMHDGYLFGAGYYP